MPVTDHLQELRVRIIWSIATVALVMVAVFFFVDEVFAILNGPLGDDYDLPRTDKVIEPMSLIVLTAAWIGLVAAVPVIVFHAYRYVAPAMPTDVRRVVRNAAFAVPALFVSGVVFAYFLVLPTAVNFLLGLAEGRFTVELRASYYYSFITMTMLMSGLVFLYPLVLIVLARIGIVTADRLRAGRRYALLIMAVAAALLMTADPFSLVIVTSMLFLMYEGTILVVAMQQRRAMRALANDESVTEIDIPSGDTPSGAA